MGSFFFPDPLPYDTGSSNGSASPTVGGLSIKKIEIVRTLNPATTAAGSPTGGSVLVAGTGFSVTVPKGATKMVIQTGAVEPVPGTGAATDMKMLPVVSTSPSEIGSGLTEGDTVTITPSWLTDDSVTLAAGKIRSAFMLFWM